MDALRSRFSQLTGHWLIGTVLAVLLLLVGRLVYINTYNRPVLLSRAQKQHRSDVPIKARRGLIVDRVGRILSGTMLRKSVFADPQVLPDKRHAAETVARVLDLDFGEIAPDLLAAGDRRFFVIRRGVTEEQARRISAEGIYGLGVFSEPYRTYPMHTLAAALIGFVAPDGRGISGLEHQCDAWLRGENGVKTIIRDAGRKAFWLADRGYRPARDGFHVVLTIDAEIQATVERSLSAAVARFRAAGGVAVVMDPVTGAVLAMANVPGFDPNDYTDSSSERYRNRTITDPFEPGSTFKPFIAAGALAEGVVRYGEVFDCERGVWRDGSRTLRDHHPYDFLTFEEIIIRSSNIGMGKLGKRLGNALIYKYVKAFGFGEKTGIDLEAEDPGILRPLPRWNDFSTTSIPMGQEIAVTPLQLTRAFCVFANGGRLVRPYVIRAVMDAEGRVVSDLTPPPAAGQALPADLVNEMKDRILCEVVNQSHSGSAKLADYQVFGKTGTAQIARKGGGGYEPNAYVSSFVGGAPAHAPRLVAFVAVRRPDKSVGYYGATVAAPVVREILGESLAYLQVPPDRMAPREWTASAGDAAED
ncbi:MAG: peptidoglycan D,D-transpeptidase FtsI family protein [Phycisphaerae bacterium]